MNFFLASSSLTNIYGSGASNGGILAIILHMVLVSLIIGLAAYLYMSFAYMAIAKKAKQSTPGLAWIPGVGPLIIAYKESNMHWWPWLLLIGYFIPFIGIITGIIFLVYVIIWHWKLFEAIGKEGWWAILLIIPIVNLVMIGIAAWSKK